MIDHPGRRAALVSWLGLMALFSAARAFFLLDYRQVLVREPFTPWEVVRVLLSATRFDSVVAAGLLAPLFLLGFVSRRRATRLLESKVVRRAAFGYALIAGFAAWLLVVSDHYFYVYFKDHFNVFFWEFWDNLSNAFLVVTGVPDVVPLAVALPILGGGFVAWWGVSKLAFRAPTKRYFAGEASPSKLVFGALAWLVLFVILVRGTFDSRPLTIQDRRVVISRNSILNLAHTHPVFPLLRSYEQRQEARSFQFVAPSPEEADAMFRDVERLIPGAKVVALPTHREVRRVVEPAFEHWLIKRPKHIVVLFLERYAHWVFDYPDPAFREAMAGELRRIAGDGILFERHFSPAGGTIKNIIAALYSFPLSRDFHPALAYHREGYKPFAGKLPVLMQRLGFTPEFYYGGTVAWHRLYDFIPKIGFARLLGENAFPDLPHHEHGLYDRDLLKAVARDLKSAEGPTFKFVMTLTNHPPFNVPEEERETPLEFPKDLSDMFLDERAHFEKLFRAFRSADQAIGAFFRELEEHPVFQETLFVLTADHSFASGIGFPSSRAYSVERLPMVLAGPLIKPELRGTRYGHFTTHLDIAPTLVALTTEEPMEIVTWGKPLWTPGEPYEGICQYFTCTEGHCLVNGVLYEVGLSETLIPAASPDAERLAQKIKAIEKSYYGTGMLYLYEHPAEEALSSSAEAGLK